MRFFSVCVVLLALAVNISTLNAQLLIADGQSYEVSFNSLPIETPGTEQPSFSFALGAFPFSDPAPTLVVQFFEDSFDETPFNTNSYVASEFGGGFFIFGWTPGWEDLQGKIRFTAQGGDVVLTSFAISSWSSGNSYGQTFVVPEPSTAFLGCAGIVALFWAGRSRRLAKAKGRNP